MCRPIRLWGPADELGSLERALDELGRGYSGPVELVAEPGIGKTRLLHELAARAQLPGCWWFRDPGRSSSATSRSLRSWMHWASFSRASSRDGSPPSTKAALAEPAHVFPPLLSLARAGELGLQDERYRTHRAVRALLERLTKSKPLVLRLDLRRADSASVELLGAQLRRSPVAPVLLAPGASPR